MHALLTDVAGSGAITSSATLHQLTNDALTARSVAGSIKSITVSDPKLGYLPPLTLTFTSLTSLNLNNSAVVSLPWNISSLTNLTSLSASRNGMNCLPSELGVLTKVCPRSGHAADLNRDLSTALSPHQAAGLLQL